MDLFEASSSRSKTPDSLQTPPSKPTPRGSIGSRQPHKRTTLPRCLKGSGPRIPFTSFLGSILIATVAGFFFAATITLLAPFLYRGHDSAKRVHDLWKKFNTQRVMQDIREISSFTPRHSGSSAHLKLREWLSRQLSASGWHVDEQRFHGNHSSASHLNLIAHTTPNLVRRPRLLLATHYDGPRHPYLSLPGAATSAAPLAVLLEIARQLALSPADAAFVEIVFFDAHEPVCQFAADDGLAGARYYAQRLGPTKPFQSVLLFGTVGRKNVPLSQLAFADNHLAQALMNASQQIAVTPLKLAPVGRQVWASHLPFGAQKLPALTLMSAEDPLAYTADDTVETIDPDLINAIGCTALTWVQRTLAQQPPAT